MSKIKEIMPTLSKWQIFSVFLLLTLMSCVTINVYFPAAQAERAADRMFDEIWGGKGAPPKAPAETPRQTPEPQSSMNVPRLFLTGVGKVLEFCISNAHADMPDANNLNLSSPTLRDLEKSMQTRDPSLQNWYTVGAVGWTSAGLLEIVDASLISLKDRNQVKKLVADENQDRTAYFREVAQSNQHPEWESSIAQVFGKRWNERAAKEQWAYQDASGTWHKKQ